MNVIRVEKIGKRYRVGEAAGGMLRDRIAGALRNPVGALRRKRRETFWALKDISFEVQEGEVLGLIGRNGAGKSTLLKVLARITKPTVGHAEIHGRVGSLLEVGTGFHPELTGRENCFLNGAILGMGRREIARKFDEIVAFAEVEKFIDTPVKHYSSGMYIRLAFAVAAHLETEILFVDEVLSVGDVSFQKKCLGKMGDVARQGRTVVFVSHQMAAVRRLCQRALWVEAGSVRLDASAHEAVSTYEAAMARGDAREKKEDRHSISRTCVLSWGIANPTTDNPYMLDHLGPVTIRITADIQQPLRRGAHGLALYDHEQRLIWSKSPAKITVDPGEHTFCHTFPMLPLRPGQYTWLATLVDDDGAVIDSWYCEPEMIIATEQYQCPYDQWTGILNMPSTFEPGTKAANVALE
jgi:lipopolysaccharide transport system ATP-binding protein